MELSGFKSPMAVSRQPLRNMAAVVETTEIVHEDDEIARSLQLGRALVVWVDAIDCSETGAAGHKQYGGMRRRA
jgi:hypothetical protein